MPRVGRPPTMKDAKRRCIYVPELMWVKVNERAWKKEMTISEYIRDLIAEDLKGAGKEAE